MKPYRIERLDRQERTGFDCGVSALNTYLQKQAGKEHAAAFYIHLGFERFASAPHVLWLLISDRPEKQE